MDVRIDAEPVQVVSIYRIAYLYDNFRRFNFRQVRARYLYDRPPLVRPRYDRAVRCFVYLYGVVAPRVFPFERRVLRTAVFPELRLYLNLVSNLNPVQVFGHREIVQVFQFRFVLHADNQNFFVKSEL